jgi:hypothetical protein
MKKGKARKEALDMYNETKIISLEDSTLELWSKIISCYNEGKLYDPETNLLRKFKENKS